MTVSDRFYRLRFGQCEEIRTPESNSEACMSSIADLCSDDLTVDGSCGEVEISIRRPINIESVDTVHDHGRNDERTQETQNKVAMGEIRENVVDLWRAGCQHEYRPPTVLMRASSKKLRK